MTQQWKPISSAPKDGSEFLACYARQGNVKQIVKWNTLHGYFSSKGEPLPGFTTNATHWQPLPADPGTPPASAQDDAKDELATFSLPPTCSLQPVATAFFTEKGEVAYTGIYDRTLKALNAVKTTRMGISAGSIDLYTKAPAPAAGDARLPALNIEAAAKAMAECMDYPWAHMPEQGRATMREHAQTVIRAASQQQEG